MSILGNYNNRIIAPRGMGTLHNEFKMDLIKSLHVKISVNNIMQITAIGVHEPIILDLNLYDTLLQGFVDL